MTNSHQEYVLHSDGNFYKRTVLETIVCNQEEALASVKTKPLFYVSNFTKTFSIEPESNGIAKKYKMYSANHISSTGRSDHQLSFIEAPYFYFSGANLFCRRVGEEFPEHHYLHIPHPGDELPEPSPTLKFKKASELEHSVRWQPSLDGLRLFFMFSSTAYKPSEHLEPVKIVHSSAPYVFVYDPVTKQSYAPNLANVFDRGDICTGDDFSSDTLAFEDLRNDDLFGLLIKSMLHLNTSLCNNDLRPHRDIEQENLKFDETGNSVPVLQGQGVPNKSTFYQPINHDSILSFTSWLNQQA